MTTTTAPKLNQIERFLESDFALQAKLGSATVVVGTIVLPIILEVFGEAANRRGACQGVWTATSRILDILEREIADVVMGPVAHIAPRRMRSLIELRTRYELEKGLQEGRYLGLLGWA